MTSNLRAICQRPMYGLRIFVRLALGVALVLAVATGFAGTPNRKVIERFIDKEVSVFGNYAAVRLPIKNGVEIWNPVALARNAQGMIYVANYTGEIYSLRDSNGDGIEDTAVLFCDVKKDGLRYSTGMVFKDNELYVGTTQEVRVYSDTNGDGVADQSRTFFKGFPWTLHPFDWTFGLRFGPDQHLYLTLSTDRHNAEAAPDPQGWRGSMLRISPDGKSAERFASGLRYAFGIDFNQFGDLFFTDNKGDDNLHEELNIGRFGAFYGHNSAKFGTNPVTEPVTRIAFGRGIGGLRFNSTSNDFGRTAGQAFIACWGPDGQFEKGSITRVDLSRQPDGTYRSREFAFAEIKKVMDVEFSGGGDLYVAQFGREGPGHSPNKKPDGAIYRFIHAPWVKPSVRKNPLPLVKGNVSRGKEVFTAYGCAACHAVDGTTKMVGPNLHDIGKFFSRKDFMESIHEPSKSIKSGHETEKIVKTDGEIITGCLLSANADEVVLMLAGNFEIKIPRNEIASQQMILESMMPPDLLASASDKEIDDLLAYLEIQESHPTWFKAKLEEARVKAVSTVPGLRLRYKALILLLLFSSAFYWCWNWARNRRAKKIDLGSSSAPMPKEADAQGAGK